MHRSKDVLTGRSRSSRSPRPSWPLPLQPQVHSAPRPSIAADEAPPAAILAMLAPPPKRTRPGAAASPPRRGGRRRNAPRRGPARAVEEQRVVVARRAGDGRHATPAAGAVARSQMAPHV